MLAPAPKGSCEVFLIAPSMGIRLQHRWEPDCSPSGNARKMERLPAAWTQGDYDQRGKVDKEPALHTAEDASPRELWGASWRLLLTLAALGLLVVPLIREFPLGQSTRTALLAWLLVGLALYWLYAGMGYRPLLLLQLMLFSTAAALLSTKLLLVVIDINRLTVLRYVARGLILVGAGCAFANLGAMLITLWRRSRDDPGISGSQRGR
jgi:hypothetical protein